MAWVASDLVAIEAAIATGEKSVDFNERRVVYRSIDELLRARDLIKRALDTETGAVPRQVRMATKKGL